MAKKKSTVNEKELVMFMKIVENFIDNYVETELYLYPN